MKKKGFTLVELVGVITLLGIIALIIFPAVSKTINKSKDQAYKEQVKMIESAGQQYIIDHIGELDDIDTIVYKKLYLSTLLPYIQKTEDGKIYNPKTDEEMTGCVIVSYDEAYGQYIYKYNDNCETSIPDEVYQIMLNSREYYNKKINTTEKINFNGATNLLKEIDKTNKADGALYIDEEGRTALAFVHNNICYTKYFTTDYYQSTDIENCGLNIDFVVESSYVGLGGEYLDSFAEVLPTSDGGYVVFGTTNSKEINGLSSHGDNMNNDAFIVKYNAKGNILWMKLFGGTAADEFYSVIEEENCYTVIGRSYSIDGDLSDIIDEKKPLTLFVLKYDKNNGELLYKKILLNSTDSYIKSTLVKYQDNYFLLTAGRNIAGFSEELLYLLKYDLDFNLIWKKPYSDRYGSDSKKLILTSNNTLLLSGYAYSTERNGEIVDIWIAGLHYSYIMEVDPDDGTILGKASIGGSQEDEAMSIIEVEDGYIIIGCSNSNDGHFFNKNKGDYDAFVAKYSKIPDSNGIFPQLWVKTFGGSNYDTFYDVELSDGYLVLAGVSNSSDYDMQGVSIASNDYRDGIMVKVDLDGNIVAKKAIGGSNRDMINAMSKVEDNFVIAGSSWSKDKYFKAFNYGNRDGFMMMLDSSFKEVNTFQVEPLLLNKLPDLVNNYGSSIPQPENKNSLDLYTTNNPTKDLGAWCTSSTDIDPNSNYNYVSCVKPFNEDDIKQLIYAPFALSNDFYVNISNPNNWIKIYFHFGNAGNGNGITNLKIKFEGHEATTVAEAIELGYIEPLVLSGVNSQYIFENSFNLITTGTSGLGSYPMSTILIKPKNKKLERVIFNSVKAISSTTRGRFVVQEFHNFDISLTKSE